MSASASPYPFWIRAIQLAFLACGAILSTAWIWWLVLFGVANGRIGRRRSLVCDDFGRGWSD